MATMPLQQQIQQLKPDSPIIELPLVGPNYAEKLTELKINTIKELLFHIPFRYRDTSDIMTISQLKETGEGTILAQVDTIKNIYTRSRKILTKAEVHDDTGTINIVWFNQRFLPNTIKPDDYFIFEGKISPKSYNQDLTSPNYEKFWEDKELAHLGKITPVYNTTAGVSSKWLRARIYSLKSQIHELIQEPLPAEIIKKSKLIPLHEAITLIHFPASFEDLEKARRRLEFDELLSIALRIERDKAQASKIPAPQIVNSKKDEIEFNSTLKFALTKDQKKAISEITEDIGKPTAMRRLLNGDVGSGKTIVAASAAYKAHKAGYSTLIMAPTTILAQQHYNSFISLFKGLDLKIQLLKSGQSLEPTIKNQLIVGTHALLFEEYLPENVGLVIVDEQHRFGVGQRHQLLKHEGKTYQPHYLTMTATPIPRTLTNILYGDMEISVIKEMPKGRIPIKSFYVPKTKRDNCLDWTRDQIINSELKEQAFVIFPLVEESEKVDLKSAVKEYENLQKEHFKDIKLGLLHGQMKDEQKQEILQQFREKVFNILIATSVVEVGIDIPDATIMIIEDADRFGLAQLHQFRGRVGRGDKQSYCYVLGSKGMKKGSATEKRLKYFVEHASGFDVAEYDLKTRGPGEVYGKKQSGIPDFKVASIMNLEQMDLSRKVARELVESDKDENFDTMLFH